MKVMEYIFLLLQAKEQTISDSAPVTIIYDHYLTDVSARTYKLCSCLVA